MTPVDGLDLYDIDLDLAGQMILSDRLDSDEPYETTVQSVKYFGAVALQVRDSIVPHLGIWD